MIDLSQYSINKEFQIAIPQQDKQAHSAAVEKDRSAAIADQESDRKGESAADHATP